ncbi:C40 family peptidase [Nocardia terpenica]|nr:C40 family peptidase [Nocardia terpenica]
MNAVKAAVALTLSSTLVLLVVIVVIGGGPGISCAATVDGGGVTGRTGGPVAGMSERQLQLARNGVAIGKQRREPAPVIVAELAAQITESTLRNLANPAVPQSLTYANDGLGYDHDSVGPHQMRASVWGAAGIAALMTPPYQFNWFYTQADRVTGRDRMSVADIAQAVENSAPDAYGASLDLAQRLYQMFAGIDVSQLPAAPGQTPGGCGTDGQGAPLTQDQEAFGQAVIRAATRWIGTPYVWGGGDFSGPTNGGFDCSALVQYALFQASGGRIRLPRTTREQVNAPGAQPIPFNDRQPGDLIFFTDPGETAPHHVAVYVGRDQHGQDVIVHAPESGQTVTLAPLWRSEHLDVRRYSLPGTSSPVGSHASLAPSQ